MMSDANSHQLKKGDLSQHLGNSHQLKKGDLS
jgi:hypothetical protein